MQRSWLFSTAFPDTAVGMWMARVERLGLELVSIFDTSSAAGSLIHYATILVLESTYGLLYSCFPWTFKRNIVFVNFKNIFYPSKCHIISFSRNFWSTCIFQLLHTRICISPHPWLYHAFIFLFRFYHCNNVVLIFFSSISTEIRFLFMYLKSFCVFYQLSWSFFQFYFALPVFLLLIYSKFIFYVRKIILFSEMWATTLFLQFVDLLLTVPNFFLCHEKVYYS